MFSKNKKNKYAGFSLMEMVVAIFVFSLITITVTTVFVQMTATRKKIKAIQKDVETARFTMEQMAKVLRSSTIFTADGEKLVISAYDHSQGKCVKYRRDPNAISASFRKIQYQDGEPKFVNGKIYKCDPITGSSWIDMSEADFADLRFDIVKSKAAASPDPAVIGKVTISMKVCYKNVCTGIKGDEARLQTTVSLRDYWEVK